MTNLSVARIIKSELNHSGVVFTFRTRDERCIDLLYGLAVNSSVFVPNRIARAKLAEVVKACGIVEMTDTSELHNIDVIIEYIGDRIKGVRPLMIVVEKPIEVPVHKGRKKAFIAGWEARSLTLGNISKQTLKAAWAAYKRILNDAPTD